MQMDATSKLLQSIVDANKAVLQSLYMSQDYPNISLDSTQKVSLLQLAQHGATYPDASWPVFSALWSEITLKNTDNIQNLGRRPPILYCVDNVSHLFVPSLYDAVTPEGKVEPIHTLDLALPRHFIDHVTGATAFPNGGIALGATSKTDFVRCPPVEVGVELAEARQQSPDSDHKVTDFWNSLQAIDQRTMDICLNLDVLHLKPVSKENAKSIIEYWAYNGMVRERLADSWIGEKWTLSGGGVLGELEKAVVRMRF